MIPAKSLVVYKNRPALVEASAGAADGEKINIAVIGGSAVKVRAKDIELLHTGPCSPKDLEESPPQGNAREAWELLLDAENPVTLKELSELVYGIYSPKAAWAVYELLKENLYFSGDINSIKSQSRQAVQDAEKKRGEKQRESGERAAFLEKLKNLPPFKAEQALACGGGASYSGGALSGEERRFLLDAEALARGKSEKSRTLKELGKAETPEEAHRLLLASGAWTVWVNPHPDRFGCETSPNAPAPVSAPPDEKRVDLTHLHAFAIDNPWSKDPDDAVSLEGQDAEGYHYLYVHVADPAASILPGSPADAEARGRGATLYLPEGPSRMLSEEAQSIFVLGSGGVSPALTFKMKLKPDLTIAETEIFPSLVKVTCLSYAEADALMSDSGSMLSALAVLMKRNEERRLDTGAVLIDLPDTHIQVSINENPNGTAGNSVSVESILSYRSAEMVRECMILSGEGAARWALQRQLAFPFVSQEAGELPARRLSGLAGAWQLRRCMRPRMLSAKPAVHWGLGLDQYTQVSSPLRRYTDLLCHQQIRAELKAGAYSELAPLGKEEVLLRVSAAEAAAIAVTKAERASKAHWLAVYLADKKGSVWEAVVLDRKGNKCTAIIPALGLETQVFLKGNEEANDKIELSLLPVKIPEAEVSFSAV